MTQLNSIVVRAPRARRERENPLGLLISVIRDDAEATQSTHYKKFRNLVMSDGYEDFLDAVIDEWHRIKYSTALRAAAPPSVKELKERAAVKKQAAERERKAVQAAKTLIGQRFLDLLTPIGKPLRECTGSECIKLGGHFISIGEAVGPRRIVGKVMTADDIAAVLERRA